MRTAWDTETYLVQPAVKVPRLVCASYATLGSPAKVQGSRSVLPPAGEGEACVSTGVVDWRREHALPLFRESLEGVSVGLNMAFDCSVAAQEFPELLDLVFDAMSAGRIEDVGIRQKLLDIAYGCYFGTKHIAGKMRPLRYSLAALGLRYLGVTMDKDTWRLRYGEFREAGQLVEEWPKGAVEYSEYDSVISGEVWAKQEAERWVENGEVDLLYDEAPQVRADWALHLAKTWGLRTHEARVAALEKKTDAAMNRIREELVSCGLIRAKSYSRDTKKAKSMVKEVLGYEVKLTVTGYNKVKKGELSHKEAVDKGYIALSEEQCKRTGVPDLEKYAEWGSLQKLKGTYIDKLWWGVDMPIHTYFNSLLETGRTSSSNPNIQNPPRGRGVRECYIPRGGNVYIACDYDKAELVALAQICLWTVGHSRLAELLKQGFDPHLDLACQILGIPYPEGLGRMGVRDKVIGLMRQMSKAANFGYPGGLGALSFVDYAWGSYGVKLSEIEAVQLKSDWMRNFPEMPEYFHYINALLGGKDKTTIMQFQSKRWRGDVPYTVACNTFFQGLTSDGAKAAAYEVARRQYTVRSSALFGTRTVNFVHDELILESREEQAHEAAMELKVVMETEYNKFTPDVPVTATPALMRCWTKCDPVYENGRLIPWEDRKEAA